jgi:hypothetical protein
MQKAIERMGEMLLKTNDRSGSLMERLTASAEKQAAYRKPRPPADLPGCFRGARFRALGSGFSRVRPLVG